MILLSKGTEDKNVESIEELVNFWNTKVRSKLSHFFKNKQLLEILGDLDKRIEKIESNMENSDFSLPQKVRLKSSTNFRASKIFKKNFIPADSHFTIKEDDEINLINMNNLISPVFCYEEEKEKENEDNDIIVYNNNNGVKEIKLISIDLLIKKISLDEMDIDYNERNINLLNGICVQYPIFIKSDILINKLISAFSFFYNQYKLSLDEEDNDNNNNNNNIESELKIPKDKIILPFRLIQFMSIFIKVHYYNNIEPLSKENIITLKDFYESIMQIIELMDLANKEITETIKILYLMSEGIYNNANDSNNNTNNNNNNYTVNKTLNSKYFNILQYNECDIAKELTRITLKMFKKIEYKEFFSAKFSKKSKKSTSPNIVAIVERFNNISFFVIEEILAYDESKTRGKAITKFIKIADELKKLNNLNDCVAVVAGLNNMSLTRLKRSWNSLSSNIKTMYSSLKKFISFENNYKGIRIAIDQCRKDNTPFIPFLGLYTKKICFIEESQSYIENNLINVNKIIDVYEVLSSFFSFKNKEYTIEENKGLRILQCFKPSNEDVLEELSEMLEPSFILAKKQSTTKRSTSTDVLFYKVYEGKAKVLFI